MADENPNLIGAEPVAPAAVPAPAAPAAVPQADPAVLASAAPADPNAAPAAPVSALVTPPAVQVENVESETADDGSISYQPTGDAALDVALSFIGGVGIAGDDPSVIAAANGDFALLEAKLAVLGDKAAGWQQMLNLAKDAYARAQVNFKAHVEKTDNAILSVVQSAENWNAIKAWAAKNADPAEKAEINKMIDAGPIQARAAATLLLNAYKAATGTVVNPSNPASNASGQSVAASNGKLAPGDYTTAVADLHRKLGNRMESSPEYAALRSRLTR